MSDLRQAVDVLVDLTGEREFAYARDDHYEDYDAQLPAAEARVAALVARAERIEIALEACYPVILRAIDLAPTQSDTQWFWDVLKGIESARESTTDKPP
jgi:hypothetical protein